MSKTDDAAAFYARLEEEGEDQVRSKLALRKYGAASKPLVIEWLGRLERERSDIFASEQMKIARDAERAARRSADASEAANTRATIALGLAAASILVSIAAALFW